MIRNNVANRILTGPPGCEKASTVERLVTVVSGGLIVVVEEILVVVEPMF